MNSSLQTISLSQLSLAFIPVFFVLAILVKWNLNSKHAVYALIRMLGQLLLIGFFLNTIFLSDSANIVLLTLAVMLCFSAWIALDSIKQQRRQLYFNTFIAILCGGGSTLAVMSQAVLAVTTWYEPKILIPLAGMIFANAMTGISLAAERLNAELSHGKNYLQARNTAFNAALLPITNSLLAVGLVSLPGMMTGQILSGVSPFVAARYQIMVMAMLFASTGLSTALFLVFSKQHFRALKD